MKSSTIYFLGLLALAMFWGLVAGIAIEVGLSLPLTLVAAIVGGLCSIVAWAHYSLGG